ncbi:MAG: DUF6629 family protein [Patescibacteria group bacterium]
MCFSASASFAAGGVLTAIGTATIKNAKTKAELPFASVPLLFGIQQAVEGVIWISFGLPALNAVMTYAYLMFAYVFWPIFFPISVLLLETNPVRKKFLRIFSLIGFVVGAYLLFFLFTDPGKAHIVNQSIAYDYQHLYKMLPLALYLLATCGSGCISSYRIINIFSVMLLASFFIAGWFFYATFVSVWCFFAAVLSFIVYAHFYSRT